MPAKPSPLKAKEPKERPEDVSDGLWQFPRNLAEWANAKGKSQGEVATMAGVSQSTVSRWLSYQGLSGVYANNIVRLEAGLGLAPGTLLRSVVDSSQGEPKDMAELRARSEQRWSGGATDPRLTEIQDRAIERLVMRGIRLRDATRGAQAALAFDPPRNAGETEMSVDQLVDLALKILKAGGATQLTAKKSPSGTTRLTFEEPKQKKPNPGRR